MLLSNIAFLFFVAPRLGNTQTVTAPASRSSTSTAKALAATHSVNVGAAGLVFTPNSLTANVGDLVEFRFYPQNHSVARAEFKNPCIPYEVTDSGKQGFWSGFRPINVVLSSPPTFTVLVNDTQPIFFYCSAPGACEEDGMVGVINPNSTQTLEIQQDFAHNATIMFSPGENFPSEIAASKTASATSVSSQTATGSPSSTPDPHPQPALGSGAIAGIAIGGVAVLLLGMTLVYLCGRQRTMGEIISHHRNVPPPYVPSPGHMSMVSATTYPQKSPQLGASPRGFPREEALYGENDSYRSRSPGIEEREYQNLGGSTSPAYSNTLRSYGRPNQLSPVTLVDESTYRRVEPGERGLERSDSHFGPHELGVENDRNYVPHQKSKIMGNWSKLAWEDPVDLQASVG